jgi:hypothetical protein
MRKNLSDRLGALLVSQNIITEEQLANALEEQRQKPYLRVGEILFGRGFINFAQLEELLEQQYTDMRLGQLLIRKGHLTAEQLEIAMQEHEETGMLLGHLIVRLGFCSHENIQRVLAEQRRYGYQD